MGLAEYEVDDISFEALVRDLETVVDALGVERFARLGILQGCAGSISDAARHPEQRRNCARTRGVVSALSDKVGEGFACAA